MRARENCNAYFKNGWIKHSSMGVLVPLQCGMYCLDFASKEENEPKFLGIDCVPYPDRSMFLHVKLLLEIEPSAMAVAIEMSNAILHWCFCHCGSSSVGFQTVSSSRPAAQARKVNSTI
jgi:hypothetical protein